MQIHGAITGQCFFVGKLLANHSVGAGNATVAQGLISTYFIWQAIFAVVYDSQPVSYLQIWGMFFGILSVLTLSGAGEIEGANIRNNVR